MIEFLAGLVRAVRDDPLALSAAAVLIITVAALVAAWMLFGGNV